MKKTMMAVFAAAAFGGLGVAHAQNAECHLQPACDPQGKNGLSYYPGYAGAGPVPGYNAITGAYSGVPQAAYGAWPQAQYQQPRAYAERNRRDRDGDGVRNNRDRYPDDPRYR